MAGAKITSTTCKWLIIMVSKSPKLVGFPFQMAELHGLQMGVMLNTYESWDDAPSRKMLLQFGGLSMFQWV